MNSRKSPRSPNLCCGWSTGLSRRSSKTLNEAARQSEATYLLFDEVQNLRDWAPQLKSLVDNSTTQVLVTGSSAMRIELGREAGRPDQYH